jgi:DNA repair exonuclease SbcCD ATPase subunit
MRGGSCIRLSVSNDDLLNAGARGRLKALDAELEELRNQQAELNAQWERERSSMTKLTQIKEEVERVNLEVQQARAPAPFPLLYMHTAMLCAHCKFNGERKSVCKRPSHLQVKNALFGAMQPSWGTAFASW